jgi:hypothetical protein
VNESKMRKTHICSFQAGPDVKEHTQYEEFRAAILKAGKFSSFEASDTRRSQRLYTMLCHDPEVETFDLGYPWTGVRQRVK